ncbi:MAG: beta-lactamase family protein, partial [Acidimicrobiia bacterium]|nr:beta-lactamase family protein [Acidimicrobiia bacterium]
MFGWRSLFGSVRPAIVLVLVVLVVAACGADSTRSDRIARVENGLLSPVTGDAVSVTEMMELYNVPGVSVAVINDFEIEWEKGYGWAEADTDRPVTAETLFQTGSIGKPITAAAVLHFVDEGRLDLDTDVNEYLTSWS